MDMLETSAALFGLAALGGLGMALIRTSRKINPPIWIAMAHGLLAAAGLTLLTWAVCRIGADSYAQTSLILFLLAAAGGAWLNLRYHWRNLPLPVGFMWGHGLLAVIAFGLLLLSINSTP
jgi:hypothetical protein